MALGKSAFLWGSLTSAHWFCTIFIEKFLKLRRCRMNLPILVQGWVWEDSPFANLSRTFREPFADFSPKKYNFRNWCLCNGGFYNLCYQGASANLRTWENTKLKPVHISIDKQKQMSTWLYTYICQSVVYMQYTDSIKDPVAILQGNCRKWILLL